jgi:adenylate cyclase
MAEHFHQLAAVLFADIVGYTAMMQEDEEDAVKKVNRFRESIEVLSGELNGKIIQYYGDGSLVLFNSSTDAAEFAKLLQEDLQEEPGIPVRVGIHMGDVLLKDGNVFGDVVNIASRIQAMAPPGGVYISEPVYRNIVNKKGLDSVFVKEEKLKNVKEKVRVYRLISENGLETGVPAEEEILPLKSPAENTIAVLPFANMSSDPEQEYFSDGLTDEIITQLSKVKAFRVISRTSVMQFKKNPKPVKEIGKELGVSFVLEGSVQRYGGQVRIIAQLIDAATDEHLWADSYDRPIKDIFSIQREVAVAIAHVLNATLSFSETRNLDHTPTANLHAYDLYLRGKILVEKRNKTDIMMARDLFQQAVNEDSNFANAYAGLADTYLLASYRGYEDPTRMLWMAKKAIDTALSLNPSSGETHATLGYWYHQNFDWHAAEITYERAIEYNPNQSNVYLWLAILLEGKGEMEDAMKIYSKGSEINPLWDYLQQNRIRALAGNNEKEEAIRLQKQLVEKASFDAEMLKTRYTELSKLHWSFGDKAEAIAHAKNAGNDGLLQFYIAGEYSQMVREVDEQYQKQKLTGEYISQLWLGLEYAKAGAREKALECFNNAIALKEPSATYLLMRHYEFINIKYLNMALITRKIRQLVNF